jgi:predicted nucleic acid-binding Zn ribbon protein
MRRGVIEDDEPDERSCIVCGGPARAGASVCSRPCLLEARRELDENVASIHQISGEEARGELMARNARLSAAMISWSP